MVNFLKIEFIRLLKPLSDLLLFFKKIEEIVFDNIALKIFDDAKEDLM
jgi:hypothetical protein